MFYFPSSAERALCVHGVLLPQAPQAGLAEYVATGFSLNINYYSFVNSFYLDLDLGGSGTAQMKRIRSTTVGSKRNKKSSYFYQQIFYSPQKQIKVSTFILFL